MEDHGWRTHHRGVWTAGVTRWTIRGGGAGGRRPVGRRLSFHPPLEEFGASLERGRGGIVLIATRRVGPVDMTLD